MPFSNILGGFETHQKQFFEIFEAKEQKEKTVKNRKYRKISGKYRKKSEIIGKYRKLSEKIGKNRTKEISVEISFRSPPISQIFRPKYRKFCSLSTAYSCLLCLVSSFISSRFRFH